MLPEAEKYYGEKLRVLADADIRSARRNEPEGISDIKKVHLTGVCGTAMGSLAGLFQEAGYEVSGSDEKCYPPMSDFIKDNNIKFYEGFDAGNVMGKDLSVTANMFGADNTEAVAVRNNFLPQLSMASAINKFFIKDRKSLVVCGTHGKTTTTGLLEHVFTVCGRDPGYLVGGIPVGSEKSYHVGSGEYFIIEGDEYDTSYFDKSPKFLHYNPYIAIVTSIELDHVDIYRDLEDYKQAFRFLAQIVKPEGLLILCKENLNTLELMNFTKAKVVTYGFDESANIFAKDIKNDESGQSADIYMNKVLLGRITTPLFGKYNLLNTLSVITAALHEGIDFENISHSLKLFNGMKRRQEIIGIVNGITVIDDFAHHPTAVRETLSGIRERFLGRRIVVFFEPRSVTSRRKIFEADYASSFGNADMIFLSTPALRSVDDPKDFIDPNIVAGLIREKGKQVYALNNAGEVLEKALPLLKSDDVVVIMSNSSFDGIHKKLLEKLKDLN